MTLIQFNPMYSMLGGYTELIQGAGYPTSLHVDDRRCLGGRRRGDRLLVLHVQGA